MAVRAVEKNEYVNSAYLSNVVKSTAGGGVIGLASKYLLPLTKQEVGGDLSQFKPLTKDTFVKSLKVKHARPVMQFVALGTGIGFAWGVTKNVLKTKRS